MSESAEVEESGQEVRLRIRGACDSDAVESFIATCQSLQLADRQLVLDVSEVSSMDSSGLGMLLVARDVSRASRVVRIQGANQAVRRILDSVNFGQLFEIV